MIKHSYASFIKILFLIINTIVVFALLSALIICFVLPSTNNAKIFFMIAIFSTFIFQFVIIRIITTIVSKYGKRKVIFKEHTIETKKGIKNLENARLFYSRITITHVLEFCPGKLDAIIDGKEETIGWFTQREINQIMTIIPKIIII